MRMRTISLALFCVILITGCASTDPLHKENDPLKYTEKLVRHGHVSLYQNGAFQVPKTSITLIPPGPDAIELAMELMGIRARQSFLLSLKRASESVYIVSEGTKLSYRLAKGIRKGTLNATNAIREFSRPHSTLLVYRSSDIGKQIFGNSWKLSQEAVHDIKRLGIDIIEQTQKNSETIYRDGSLKGRQIKEDFHKRAQKISSQTTSHGKSSLFYAKDTFIKGYAVLPEKLKDRIVEMGEDLEKAKFRRILTEENRRRREWSEKATDLMGKTIRDYNKNIKQSFQKVKEEFQTPCHTTGLSFPILKSLRWVVQGLFWDAVIAPLGKVSAASLGYIGVNCLAYPTLVVVREGITSTHLAAQVTWDSAKMGYDVVAPTSISAVAGIFGLLEITGGNLLAAGTAAGGTLVGYGEIAGSRFVGALVKGGGYGAGKTVQYIGVPLGAAGIAVGGGTIGTVVGGAGAATGGSLFVAGETVSAGTYVFGNLLSGTTLAGGTAVSTVSGAGYGIYELSKAVIVPSGYELGGGIVLSYETLTQLSAQSILAVSDCAYMVLSLEGPRWVLYAVKGTLGKGEDLPPGTVLDLKEMQKAGEEIYYVPVSSGEMEKVVNSVYDNLPVEPQGSRSAHTIGSE